MWMKLHFFIYLLKKSRSGHEVHWNNKTRNNHLKMSDTTNLLFLLQIKANLISTIIIQVSNYSSKKGISPDSAATGAHKEAKNRTLHNKIKRSSYLQEMTFNSNQNTERHQRHNIFFRNPHPPPTPIESTMYVSKKLKCRSLSL